MHKAMRRKAMGSCLLAAGIGVSSLWAGDTQKDALEARYTEMLTGLQEELKAALPDIDTEARKSYVQARKAEDAAKAQLSEAQSELGAIGSARGLVGHARGHWIGQADRNIAASKKQLEAATTDAEREEAEKALARWQQNRAAGVAALEQRTAAYEKLKENEPQLQRAVEEARAAVEQANAQTSTALQQLGLDAVLASDALDGKLAKFVVLLEGKPARLAAFAAESETHAALVDALLADRDLMRQMLVADGAQDGRYGQAMQIYDAIQKASDKASEGTLQRLALAIALEHAKPIGQRNPRAATDAPSHVDPVNRYLQYEKAYLNAELDSHFPGLRVWDYRFVVDGNEPDETLVWGREMLRNYRPDHITTGNESWRYVALVRTDIRYGSQDVRHDRDDLQFFQNILMNGGVCGRRAFMGRFILRAFGMPTTARPQRGHGALVRWTPNGWVPILGAGWGSGWTRTRYDRDRDFLANTQAREADERFLEVKRAQWIGDVMGESRVFGFHSGNPDFWYGVSLYQQREIIDALDAQELGAVGEELSEANESSVQYAFESADVKDADLEISVAGDGVITIPAVASSSPTSSTAKIIFMNSFGGGKQMHYSRAGGAQDFEYTFDAPAAGRYALSAHLVTPSWQQHLSVAVNGADAASIALPHTVGMWDTTDPVVIELAEGQNVLRFSHRSDGYGKGFSIKAFTLTPVQ